MSGYYDRRMKGFLDSADFARNDRGMKGFLDRVYTELVEVLGMTKCGGIGNNFSYYGLAFFRLFFEGNQGYRAAY